MSIDNKVFIKNDSDKIKIEVDKEPVVVLNGKIIKPYIFNINDNDNYLVCSAKKTGSTTIQRNIVKCHGYKIFKVDNNYEINGLHSHDFNDIQKRLTYNNQTIITLVRNIVDTRVSFFMHKTLQSLKMNQVSIPILKKYNNQEWIFKYNNFNNEKNYDYDKWYNNLMSLIKYYDKSRDYEIYNFPNNNKLIIIKLESLNKCENEIMDILNLKNLKKYNIFNDRVDYHNNKILQDPDKIFFKELYQKIKKIIYSESDITNKLNCEINNFFYTKQEIKNFQLKLL